MKFNCLLKYSIAHSLTISQSINEQNSTNEWREGFLMKRGNFRRNWLKRWFILRDEFLFYYELKGERERMGEGERF
jgi:hypothetical protein